MRNFADVIACWPGRLEVAEDCGVDIGVVKQWQRRNSIPSMYWRRLIEGAGRRQIDGIDLNVMAALAEPQADAPEPTPDPAPRTESAA